MLQTRQQTEARILKTLLRMYGERSWDEIWNTPTEGEPNTSEMAGSGEAGEWTLGDDLDALLGLEKKDK